MGIAFKAPSWNWFVAIFVLCASPGCGDAETGAELEDLGSRSEASAVGCTKEGYGAVCIAIEGDGLTVERVGVTRVGVDEVCNYRGKFTVRTPDGELVERRKSKTHSGCDREASFEWKVDRHYPDDSKACVSFYEDDELLATACEMIEK